MEFFSESSGKIDRKSFVSGKDGISRSNADLCKNGAFKEYEKATFHFQKALSVVPPTLCTVDSGDSLDYQTPNPS